jgi:molybdenum cofactor cytidylyltransferase
MVDAAYETRTGKLQPMSIVPIEQLGNRFIGVLLAGGRGERFRASAQCAQADKLLSVLPDGRQVAVAAALAMRQAVPVVVAVVRPGTDTLSDALRQAGCVVLETADAARGMGASLACAARGLMRAGAGTHALPLGCIVALADMPWVAPATFASVQQAAPGHRISAAAYRGRRGHPVVFAWDLLPELAALDGDEGARVLLRRHGVWQVPCDDPGVLRDVDTIADLQGLEQAGSS